MPITVLAPQWPIQFHYTVNLDFFILVITVLCIYFVIMMTKYNMSFVLKALIDVTSQASCHLVLKILMVIGCTHSLSIRLVQGHSSPINFH